MLEWTPEAIQVSTASRCRRALHISSWSPHPSPPTPVCVQRRLSGLTAYFLAQLHTVEGCTALEASPPHLRCGHIVGLRFAPGAATGAAMMSQLNARLKRDFKVIASVRSGYLRIAPYVYNTSAEMAAVARLVAQMAAEVSTTAAATAAAGSVAGLPRPPPVTALLRDVAAAAAAHTGVRPFKVLVTGR